MQSILTIYAIDGPSMSPEYLPLASQTDPLIFQRNHVPFLIFAFSISLVYREWKNYN